MPLIALLFIGLLSLQAQSLHIAAASNISAVAQELIALFKKSHPETEVKLILASSGKLSNQIRFRAPYDLFLSADTHYPQKLYQLGMGIEPPKVYAKGRLVLFSKTPRTMSKGLELLLDDSISRIALAHAKTAPYGKASLEALKKAKLFEKVKAKIIYGESITQTLSYGLSVSDAALLAKSLLFSPKMAHFKEHIHWIELPRHLYKPIRQAMLLIHNSPQATAFYRFMQSKAAQKLLKQYGYELP